MTQSLLLAIAATLLGTFLPATDSTAAVFSRDWQTPGDGLLTYDDVNQREWLDLSETLVPGRGSFSQFLDSLLPGGSRERFQVATSSDVAQLSESAGVDVNSFGDATNTSPATNLINLVGDTNPSIDFIGSSALVSPLTGSRGGPYMVDILPDGYRALERNPSAITSVWIYRSVPEPTTWPLATAILFMRRNNSRNSPRRNSSS